ncbi:putative signal transduction histidine kinase [Ktedonobacter racemifer DSM 44963]|uniref:histidine kinase n=1 Tax=Ktedonobacter racemifer DSM 44963 TaxID=485913 RepID=D6TKA6_KTERA|nr:putative signal transduction histidine kinase [Ktedonobacter racemifer DSM 44963]
MLDYVVSISSRQTKENWWHQQRIKFRVGYLLIGLILLAIGSLGHLRLLNEVGKSFGGFYWAVDTDGRVVIVSTTPELTNFNVKPDTLTSSTRLVSVNGVPAPQGLTQAYAHARPGTLITYTFTTTSNSQTQTSTISSPAMTFTLMMWWQNYGLSLVTGFIWLLIGGILLFTASDWNGAVEGITMIPPAMLLLLYSHWGNIQVAYAPSLVFQLLWVPAFALMGASFIHLSLTYRPTSLHHSRMPSLSIDLPPYLPLIALLAYEWSSLLLTGRVPTRVNLTASLGYAVFGGLVSLLIGLSTLIYVLPGRDSRRQNGTIPTRVRHRIFDLFMLWLGAVGLGACLGVVPILFTGHTLIPLTTFYMLAAIYPLVLFYAIRSLRLLDRLHLTLEQREVALQELQKTSTEREQALYEQQKTARELHQSNRELEQATSLLLHADAHLRSLLSQRIHDQPKQHALRIRSLLGHWQHKLSVEADRSPDGRVDVRPVVEALTRVRKISEELESDLRGLQLLVEDAYQRRSLGLRLHLEKLVREDLPALHPESHVRVQADLWALDVLILDLEKTPEGESIAEAISYTITQALLNVYNHAGAKYARVFTEYNSKNANAKIEVTIQDNGRGFDPAAVPLTRTSLFKARLKAREAGGFLTVDSVPRTQDDASEHGTVVRLTLPLPASLLHQEAALNATRVREERE